MQTEPGEITFCPSPLSFSVAVTEMNCSGCNIHTETCKQLVIQHEDADTPWRCSYEASDYDV